jgi:hypothetical protein
MSLKNTATNIAEYCKLYAQFIVVGGVTLILSLRLFLFVDDYSVNLIYWDQWDFLTPLFEGRDDLWTLFSWQHGPHRQGIGCFIIKLVALVTDWNTRADAFSIAAVVVIACILALILKYRLFGSIGYSDVVIPLFVLNLNQFEIFIGTANISLSALPLVLLLLYSISWTIKNKLMRYGFVVILNTLMLFTGFGLIIYPITWFMFGLDMYQEWREGHRILNWISIGVTVLMLLPLLLFLIDYRFDSGVPCFRLSRNYLSQYPTFMSFMFAKYLRMDLLSATTVSKVGGAILIFTFVVIFFFHLYENIRKKTPQSSRIDMIILILIGYSLLFSASTAIGRICLGLNFAMSSRYMTLLIPAFLGLYFHLNNISGVRSRNISVMVMILVLTISLLPFSERDLRGIEFYSVKKENWKQCYLENTDWSYCNKIAKLKVYPFIDERLQDRMEFLKENQLNLFSDTENK